MTDTGTISPPALDSRDALFVSEFLKDRNPAAACARAGISPRKAAAMMNNPDIATVIERQLAATAAAPPATVSLDALIADAATAYETAKASGNAAAMTAATQLKARLVGLLDGAADAKPDAAVEAAVGDTRNLARILMHELPAQVVRAIRHVLEAEQAGRVVVTLDPQLAAMLGEKVRALYPNDATDQADELEATVAAVRHPDFLEPETFPNGASIERTETVPPTIKRDAMGENFSPAITKWAVRDFRGELHGYRRSRAAAAALAKSLPPGPEV
jgi:hypothetical protein